MNVQLAVVCLLVGSGLVFMFISLIRIARFQDFFTRLHAQGVGDTLGAFLIIAGMSVAEGANLLSAKVLLVFIIIVLTNPLGTNLMMIAAVNKEDYQGYRTLLGGSSKQEDIHETEDDGGSQV